MRATVMLTSLLALNLMRLGVAGFFSLTNGEGNLRRSLGSNAPLVASRWARADQQRLESHGISEALKTSLPKHHDALLAGVERIKGALRPLFVALPKNRYGRLEHATARYALHRHFVRKYSAYIIGLEPTDGTWNTTSPLVSLKGRVSSDASNQIRNHVEAHGFDLQELALLASSLELFIRLDAEAWLMQAYELTATSLQKPINANQLKRLRDVFLWIMLGKHTFVSKNEPVSDSVKEMPSHFPDWVTFQRLFSVAHTSLFDSETALRTVDEVKKIVGAFMDNLGKSQLEMCNSFADQLIKKDTSGTGRVKLSEFYGSLLLSETPETLKMHGVLAPESEGYAFKDPSVIIANYVASAANCLGATDKYALCCPDACEDMLSALELRLASPTARPEQIFELVQTIPSRLQPAPRKLSDIMLTRLRDIAEHHHGRVPLHGRLFAQWLHHAYPYECVFPTPRESATTRSSVHWYRARTPTMYFTEEEAADFVRNRVKDLEGGDLQETLPWLTEEYVFLQAPPPSLSEELGAILRCLSFCGAVFGVVHALLSRIRPNHYAHDVKKACV
eukprot:TRINITY_DN40155_c0_g1_i1.p1 TRINITY_DN40155_c0_g1~~TRINITY_DN40155_c0_g1_i1.p1  ORF type:complete len:563 (+),score=87.11 TRINITY_DN40155_c0_g1_i1:83-1771(+)